MEAKKSKLSQKKWRKLHAIGLIIFAIAMTVSAAVVYIHELDNTIEQNMEDTITEFAAHDVFAVESYIKSQWNNLHNVSAKLLSYSFSDMTELQNKLSKEREDRNFTHLYYVTDTGRLYSDTGKIFQKPVLDINPQLQDKDEIILRYKGNNGISEFNSGIYVCAIKVNYKVAGKSIAAILGTGKISDLTNKIGTNSFFDANGTAKGHTSIVNPEDGLFLVNSEASVAITGSKNIYELLETAEFEKNFSLDKLRSDIEARRSGIFTRIKVMDNDERLVLFKYNSTIDKYFVVSVAEDVLTKQISQYMKLSIIFVSVVAVVVIAATFFVVLVFARNRSQREVIEFEKQHRDELSDALNLAEQASRAKTTFLNNMSHDIRTPMNAIIGFTALAHKNIENTSAVKDYLDKIDMSSKHLLSLINDVLDMSRIESGKVSIEERPEDLLDIIDGLITILNHDIEAKHIDFVLEKDSLENSKIVCDRLRLNQVLLNILSNSVKYTQPFGKIVFSVKELAEEEGKISYEFSVRDNGIGMSPEFIKTIFEPFSRERTSTVSGIQGSGLGMSIVKNIIDRMGGTINITSEEHNGSEFVMRFSFPLHNESLHVDEIKTIADIRNSELTKAFMGKRILLVEDNELNREIAVEILNEAGFVVEPAEDGVDAVDIINRSPSGTYDLILMDIFMPILNGYEATRKIRELDDPEKSRIPIIAMTANAFEEDKKAAEEAGMNAYVSKPIDITVLLNEIRKFV